MIRNHNSNNDWWCAFYVDNLQSGVSITKFEMRDSDSDENSDDDWIVGNKQSWGPFVVNNVQGSAWILPYDIRLTSDSGDVLTGSDVITDLNANSEFDFGSYFPAVASIETNGNGNDDNTNIEVIVYAVVGSVGFICIAVVVIIGLTYWFKKRNKSKDRRESEVAEVIGN